MAYEDLIASYIIHHRHDHHMTRSYVPRVDGRNAREDRPPRPRCFPHRKGEPSWNSRALYTGSGLVRLDWRERLPHIVRGSV
jgi:hypothetical protein